MRLIVRLVFLIAVIAAPTGTLADDVALFDGAGKASAYIAVDDELTIYLWSGEPVAYLEQDSAGGFHIYGFNGKHLGWFVDGLVRNHDGDAACATKERLRSTAFEPFKAFKQFKPFKSFKEFAPFRPFLTNSWGETACQFLFVGGER
jgi:hypothetical protein